VLQQASG